MMNQRLQGWQLALALLIPAAIIVAAGYFAYGALSDDDQSVDTAADTPTATVVAETDVVDPTAVADPTPLAEPTALTLPSPPPAPAATAVPATTATVVPTVAPTSAPTAAPTTAPGPQPTSGPAPTATPDPSIVTVSCSGDIPETADTGQTFGPLTAVTVPAEAAAGYTFTWTLGNSTVLTSPKTGNISYAETGTYTITLAGANATTGAVLSATCGTVTVGEAVSALSVSCSVASQNSVTKLADARAGDTMTVTTSWTPADVPLSLTYEFETTDDLIIINPASSGDVQTNAFTTDGGAFSVFWRYAETGETGRLLCPAYPGAGDA